MREDRSFLSVFILSSRTGVLGVFDGLCVVRIYLLTLPTCQNLLSRN